MFLSKHRSKKITSRTRSPLRWLLVIFIVAAGFFPMVTFNYYFSSGKLGSGHSSLPTTIGDRMNTAVAASRGGDSISNISSSSSKEKNGNDAIVYLAQFGNHSSYGAQHNAQRQSITGLSKLNKSLELLYANYVYHHPTDVIIFYDRFNSPDEETIFALSRNRPNLQFRSLDNKWWSLPYGLLDWDVITNSWSRPAFSVGYRKMMRWFAILLYPYLQDEGYTHCMRLDDDSYILSKIDYNLFDYMRQHKKRYGFRNTVWERDESLDALIDEYLIHHTNETTQDLINSYKQGRGVGFYNNFFIADISFFTSPPASTLLRIIDESKLIFTHRLGDLVIQSAVVRLFLRPEGLWWFRDFTYEHMTLCRNDKCGYLVRKGCPQNGGVSRGNGQFTDDEWRKYAQEEVRNRFKDNLRPCNIPINDHFAGASDVRKCSNLEDKCGFYLKSILGNDTSTTI